MKRKLTTVLTITFLFCLAFALAGILNQRDLTPKAQASSSRSAAGRCQLSRLDGSYGIFANGTVVTPPPGVPAGPFATVGMMEVEEDGTATVKLTRSFNGVITRETLPGVLTINDDCRGTATFGGVRTFDIISVDGGNELQFIQTNPGSVVTVIAKRQ
jgi:hypothetical protein